MKNPIISTTPKPKRIRLQDFPRILSRKNTWYLIDQCSDIWYTEAIPGTSMMSESMLEELYSTFNVYWLFGHYEEKDSTKYRAVTNVINMYDTVANGMPGTLTIDDVGEILYDLPDGRHLTSFGTVLFADSSADVRKGKAKHILNANDKNPFMILRSDLEWYVVSNDLEEIFARSDKELENLFVEDFSKLYHRYNITNRGGDTDKVLKRIADKLLY